MEKIIVSACLLGNACRYDGKSKPNEAVIALREKYKLIPICPEVMGVLPTPRIPAERRGEHVICKDGGDVTAEYERGAQKALNVALENGCKAAVLKARSPSCGKGRIYDGTHTGTLTEGDGVCAELFIKNGINVIDETELDILYEDSSK